MDNGIRYGRWLKQKRGVRGTPGFVSQQALADAVGVLRTYINQIENGRVGTPDPPLRDRIHTALGTTEDELIELGIVKDGTLYGVGAGSGSAIGSLTVTPSEAHNPFEKGTWHWVVMQRVRPMDDAQAEAVASFAEYILTRKKTELPVIVRGATAPDRVAP